MRTLKCLSLGLLVCLASSVNSGEKQAAGFRGAGPMSGLWKGVYHYPEGSGQNSVNFHLTLIQEGDTIVGLIKEPNTFGERMEPWLHATFKGSFEAKAGKLTWVKTYDGTAGPGHDVEYSGERSKDGTKVEGEWAIGEFKGRFVLQRMGLDDKTLEALKKGPEKE